MSKFNLSDKETWYSDREKKIYNKEDVKEFIRLNEKDMEKEFVKESVELKAPEINMKILRIINKIKKRAGDKLK